MERYFIKNEIKFTYESTSGDAVSHYIGEPLKPITVGEFCNDLWQESEWGDVRVNGDTILIKEFHDIFKNITNFDKYADTHIKEVRYDNGYTFASYLLFV